MPESCPATRKVVLPETLVVTRPLCRLTRSSAPDRVIDSKDPVMTKVFPVKQSG